MIIENDTAIEPTVDNDEILRYLLRQSSNKHHIVSPVFPIVLLTFLSTEKDLVENFKIVISSCPSVQDENLQLFIEILTNSLTTLSEGSPDEPSRGKGEPEPLDTNVSKYFLRAAYREAGRIQEENDYSELKMWRFLSWIGLQSNEESRSLFSEKCLGDDTEPAQQVRAGREIVKKAIFHKKGKISPNKLTEKN